jgi:serine protease inhibitor
MLLHGEAMNPPPPPPPFQMIVNRPFVFAICDDSGAVVFLAAVVDPLAG